MKSKSTRILSVADCRIPPLLRSGKHITVHPCHYSRALKINAGQYRHLAALSRLNSLTWHDAVINEWSRTESRSPVAVRVPASSVHGRREATGHQLPLELPHRVGCCLSEGVERLVVELLVVHVQLCADVLHHPPVEVCLCHVLQRAPQRFSTLSSMPNPSRQVLQCAASKNI